MNPIPFVDVEGIRQDTLGGYLSGLGLLAAVSRNRNSVFGCWRRGHFVLVGEGLSPQEVEDILLNAWKPTDYERWWKAAQEADKKTDRQIWMCRNRSPDLQVRVLDCHIVGNQRNVFNPVFGSGGNSGRRDFSSGSVTSWQLVKKEPTKAVSWLKQSLWGGSITPLPFIGAAGSWFVSASEKSNSGWQWFREGGLSPWSYLLAVEGSFLLSGNVSRRLGSRARAFAAFPFVTEPPSPTTADEIGKVKAEFWAPIWERPASLAEVRVLLNRGKARVANRAASQPHEFAMAAITAGLDFGIKHFVRFSLRQTTSSKTFESLTRQTFAVAERSESRLLLSLLPWLDFLQREPSRSGPGARFAGLRGPVEEAILKVGSTPDSSERWQELLLLVAKTQARVDLNRDHRAKSKAVGRLDPAWFERCFPDGGSPEMAVARAIASVGAGTAEPLLVNIFGVEVDGKGGFRFPKERPARAVWHNADPVRALVTLIERRLVDAGATESLPLAAAAFCPALLVERFLEGSLDLEEVARWIPALALLDWQQLSAADFERDAPLSNPSGEYLLQSLFRVMFHSGKVRISGDPLFRDHLRPHAGLARRVLALIRQRSWDEATSVVRERLLAAGRGSARFEGYGPEDGDRMAAALLVPLSNRSVEQGVARWLTPGRTEKR